MSSSLICIHGALGTAAQFDGLKAQSGMPPITALNLPGHAGVACDGPFSNAIFADAIFAKMNEMGIEQADLFGYSMGGYVALWIVWKFPEKIRSIVTLNTKLDWTPETATRMTGMFDTEKITAKAPQMADALAKAHAPGDWKTVAEKTARFLLELGNGAAIPTAAFGQITCPVRILRGELDSVVSEAESRAVAQLIPGARYTEIPGSKHPIELVDIAVVSQLLQL